jgi:hypothetical protein
MKTIEKSNKTYAEESSLAKLSEKARVDKEI